MTSRSPAFEALFHAEFDRCTRVARRMTGDAGRAEELTAEAFARAWSRWSRLRPADAGGWILRVTVNLAIDEVRRTARRPDPDAALPSSDAADAVATRLALSVALGHLPKRQRHVVALRYLADMSEADVADYLGVSPGTVKTHLHRALTKLRQNLEEDTLHALEA